MPYRAEIDGLRAIAVAAVIAAHAGVPLAGGHLGVDMFFVISGYLITTGILADLNAGQFSLAGFYGRRARRILPALALVVAVSVPLAWLLMAPDDLKRFGQAVAAIPLFSQNVIFWHQGGYFAASAGESVLLHTWSLAVEEQFYLLFPLVLLGIWRRRWAVWILCLAGAASFLATLAIGQIDRDAVFYLLPFRVWELLAGALVALRPLSFDVRRDVWRGALGLALIGAGLWLGDPWGTAPQIWAAATVLGTVLLVSAPMTHGPVTWILTRPPVRLLGVISYSAYLWHQPVFAFARLGQFEPPTPSHMTGLVALTLGLAWLSWRFVEQPCRKMVLSWPRVLGTGAVACACLGFGIASHASQGFPLRLDTDTAQVLHTARPSPKRAACHSYEPDALPVPCRYFSDGPARWAVLGDSHGVELAYALAERLSDRGESVLHLSASACPPSMGFQARKAGCSDWLSAAVALIASDPEVTQVLLAARHGYYLAGVGLTDRAAPGIDGYWHGIERTIAALRAAGKDVVLLEPVPELRQPIQKHVLFHGDKGRDLVISARSAYAAQNAAALARLPDLAVHVVAPAEALCDALWCYGVRDGAALYYDDDHLSIDGARKVIDLVLASGMAVPRQPEDGRSQITRPPAPYPGTAPQAPRTAGTAAR